MQDQAVCSAERVAEVRGARLWAEQHGGSVVRPGPWDGVLVPVQGVPEGGVSAFDHAQEFIRMSQGENVIRRCGGANHEDGWRESFTAAGGPIVKPRVRGGG